jgi:hypothetical protein
MPRQTNIWYDTASNTGASYGVTDLPTGTFLMRVQVRAAISFPSEVITQPNDGFVSHVITGIQLLDTPSTLLELPGDINAAGWLTVEHPLTNAVQAISWSPSTADAALETTGYVALDWAGNVNCLVEKTLAWTTGSLGGAPPGWYSYGTMQYWIGGAAP